jgi:hypothetical protein
MFLQSSTYRAANGSLDVAKLKADFACISLVGTRGSGYKKGLQAAILAVSPDLTGFAPSVTTADATKPNHGFIRDDADLSVIFVSDENDCSNDGSIQESGGGMNGCGVSACDYWASEALAGTSPLLKGTEFEQRFMAALSATKGRAVAKTEVVMAGVVGLWKPFGGGSFPMCGMSRPEVPIACSDPLLGLSTSGDRYQRAIRRFPVYFPNAVSKDAPLDFSKKDFGWMCAGDFSPALSAIGQLVSSNAACKPREVPCKR